MLEEDLVGVWFMGGSLEGGLLLRLRGWLGWGVVFFVDFVTCDGAAVGYFCKYLVLFWSQIDI